MVEWTETDDTKNIVFFHFDDSDDPGEGSWLMHSGRDESGDNESFVWAESRIDWNVSDVEHLKILFSVVQHVLNLLSWSASDILELYCGISLPNESATEYIR